MKKIMIQALFLGALLAGTASVASAQTTREFFDKKGRYLYSISYYGEKELPAAVREQVKPVYYDYTILSVEEVKLDDHSIYFINMEDETTLKTVRGNDDGITVVSDLVGHDLHPQHLLQFHVPRLAPGHLGPGLEDTKM